MDEYINKNSLIPYYVQLKEIIGNKIDNNDFKKNKLWSENEFAKAYGVNFLTVRKALGELRNEGRIFTIKGVGTLIKEPKLEIDISKFLSFGKALKDKGLTEEINVIEKKVINYNKNLFGKYEIKNCSKKIIYIERFRNIDNEPIAYENIFLNYDLCAAILNEKRNDLLIFEYLINNLKINIKSIEEYLEPKKLSLPESKILNAEEDDPAFLVTRISYDNHENWLEFRKIVLKGDKCSYYMKIK